MVALCQNGWPVIDDASGVGRYTIPGTAYTVTARPGDSSVILLDWLGFVHAEVEPLLVPGVWGWAVRTVRGSTTEASNHSGGDAVDASAPRHPLGTDPAANWLPNPQQINRLHRRLAACRKVTNSEVLRWGGDYTGRKDGMHAELLGTVNTRRALADAIRSGTLPDGELSYLVGSARPFRSTTPKPPEDDDMATIITSPLGQSLQIGDRLINFALPANVSGTSGIPTLTTTKDMHQRIVDEFAKPKP